MFAIIVMVQGVVNMDIKFNSFVKENIGEISKVTVRNDVNINNCEDSCFPISNNLLDIKDIVTSNDMIKEGTMFFFDPNNKIMVIRSVDKHMICLDENCVLDIDLVDRSYTFTDIKGTYSSKDLDRETKRNVHLKIIDLADRMEDIENKLPIEMSLNVIFAMLGIVNTNRFNVIVQDESIMLCLRDFRKLDPHYTEFTIADAYTYEAVGTIDFSLKHKGDSNFSFSGNVSYMINENYGNNGYATAALALLKKYINGLSDEYNKELYIATLVNDMYYQKVAISNGGVLDFEGTVPEGEYLRRMAKVKDVRIYRISDL